MYVGRNHALEIEVQKCLFLKVKSIERKNALALLRKKGNFLNNQNGDIRPAKKPNITSQFLPCTYCLGFYVKQQLWNHKKKCPANPNNYDTASRASDSQSLLVQ